MYDSSPISSCLVSVVACFSFVLSSIHLGYTSDKDQLSAGSTPSRVSGTPTLTAISQAKPGLALTAFLVLFSLGISAAAGTQWIRSPGPGRLHRQPTPDPPPPAGEDDEQDNDDLAGDNGEQNGDGGGDDDPQEDGVVDGGENGGTEDGMATAAAPAPEDPPPPAGGIEEDEDRRPFVAEGGFSWEIVIFILGHGLLSAAFRKWASRGTKANRRLPDVQKSATIPGLLQRRLPAANDVKWEQRASAYYQPPPIHWRVYLLLVGLPGLGLVIAVLQLLRANGNVHIAVRHGQELVPQADDDDPLPTPPTTPRRHRPPPAPHPSPISPQRLRPIAPLPFRDAKTQETCDKMVLFLKNRTAGRQQTRRDGLAAGERERNEKIRAVQRRVWGLILELRREGAWADDEGDDEHEHEHAAVGDEEEIAA
ncbi:hypothetical protein C8R46DRAFT_1215973 [Mycena filopes]|nr:hypothetical protein C8R46DRAFT_1215973 [Mycena filopes]